MGGCACPDLRLPDSGWSAVFTMMGLAREGLLCVLKALDGLLHDVIRYVNETGRAGPSSERINSIRSGQYRPSPHLKSKNFRF